MHNIVIDTMLKRRAVRGYTTEPLTEDQISDLVQVALISPSGMNRQPWHLTVVENKEMILELEADIIAYYQKHGPAALVERNKERGNKIFYNAPTLFVISVAEEDGLMDVGIMAQSINIGAKSMGLSSVTLGLPQVAFLGESGAIWKERLKFPLEYEYGIIVAVGHGNTPAAHRDPDLDKVSFVK